MNLRENFSYISEKVLNEAKENLVDSEKNLTPEILQALRRQMKDVPLKYEEIREKLGKVPVIGNQTKTRVVEVLKNSTDLDHKKIDGLVDLVLAHFSK